MATRSTIAVENEDGTIAWVYCHWDGYVSHNGRLLVENYNTRTKALGLVALGSISLLAENLFPSEHHTFEDPQPGVVVAYYRDRGEDFTMNVCRNRNEYEVEMQHSGEEYNYLFTKDMWFVCGYHSTPDLVVELLEKELAE